MKKSKIALVLYIVAALLGVMFIYTVISNVSYVSSYASGYGMSISDMLGQAISYVLTNSLTWLVYGILVFASARILQIITPEGEAKPKKSKKAKDEEVADEAETETAALEEPKEDAKAEETEEASEAASVPPIYTSNTIMKH